MQWQFYPSFSFYYSRDKVPMDEFTGVKGDFIWEIILAIPLFEFRWYEPGRLTKWS